MSEKVWSEIYKEQIFLDIESSDLIFAKNLEKDEVERYTDIIEANFIDSYYNLTLKSLGAISFYVEKCQNSDTLLLLDDDINFKYSNSAKFTGIFKLKVKTKHTVSYHKFGHDFFHL